MKTSSVGEAKPNINPFSDIHQRLYKGLLFKSRHTPTSMTQRTTETTWIDVPGSSLSPGEFCFSDIGYFLILIGLVVLLADPFFHEKNNIDVGIEMRDISLIFSTLSHSATTWWEISEKNNNNGRVDFSVVKLSQLL